VRVVAGTARGRRLAAPAGSATRPTSDRVREAVFNALASARLIEDATVLDLFAGTGALGIEALSRGAAHATFVERDRAALAVVASNLEATGLRDRATLVHDGAERVLAGASSPVDLALVDPPYAYDRWAELLDLLRARFVVVESDRTMQFGSRWRVVREKRYGGTVVTFLEGVGASGAGSGGDEPAGDGGCGAAPAGQTMI